MNINELDPFIQIHRVCHTHHPQIIHKLTHHNWLTRHLPCHGRTIDGLQSDIAFLPVLLPYLHPQQPRSLVLAPFH